MIADLHAGAARTAAQVAEPLTRDGARDLAREELSKPEYRVGEPSLLDRAVNWIAEQLGELFARAVSIVPGAGVGLVLIVVAVVAIAIAVRLGLGPLGVRDALRDRRRGSPQLTADDYRAEAERHAAAGRWKEAVRARFRAIVRELEHRGVLDPRPGRTTAEITAEAAPVVPEVAGPLRSAAGVFDAVWYGDRAAGPAELDAVRAADDAVRGARLVLGGAR